MPENETDSYTDKIVTEIKLSKPMDHVKKNVIYDIRIDEGVPSLDKILVGNEEVDPKESIVILHFALEKVVIWPKEE